MNHLGYVDVRGVNPILFVGMRGYVLWGQHRSITVAAARLLVGLPVE